MSEWQPAPVPSEPNTMSLEELHRSRVLACVDVVLFFSSAMVALKYWIDTQLRIRDLRRVNHDPTALASRRLFLQLLGLSNFLRALGLVLDAKFRSIFGKDHHAHIAWHRCFDYIISSFPTLVWCSMLSVLLLHILEMHFAWRRPLASPPNRWLRPCFALANLATYGVYAGIAAATLPRRYVDFRHGVYFLLGCAHVVLVSGLAYFGCVVRAQIRDFGELENRRVWMLALVPLTEMVRTVNDFEYSLGFLPFNLNSGLSSLVFLAIAKLLLEWLPSVCILYVFRPRRRPAVQLEDYLGAHGLINPLLVPKHSEPKPDTESSASDLEREAKDPPSSMKVDCGSPRWGFSEREWKELGVDDSWICDAYFNDSSVDSSALANEHGSPREAE